MTVCICLRTRPKPTAVRLAELMLRRPPGSSLEMGEMAVREEARGLLLPTAIFARWSKS